jgi:pimeloyl-ACP methyl ester carboxylesterase
MATFTSGDVTIHFDERGAGYPLLALAPGGMRSTIDFWSRAALDPWTAYTSDLRVIAMDQRNAGSSHGPLPVDDPWGAYADDQLGLMDHLGIDRFLVLGCCIGCSFALKLIERAPGRIVAAVLQQPIGVQPDNAALFEQMRRSWADELLPGRPDLDEGTMERFLAAMWRDDFVVSVDREVISSCPVPLLVLPGIDDFHPTEAGRQVARLAPAAEVVEPWKDSPEHVAEATEKVRRFLLDHAA